LGLRQSAGECQTKWIILLVTENKMKNAALIVLAILVVWLSVRVIELESFRYATFVGFCSDAPMGYPKAPSLERYECLKGKETRTNPLWHLFYALVDGV
jgi:hypothetical protein